VRSASRQDEEVIGRESRGKDEHCEQDPTGLSLVGTLLLLVDLSWSDELRVRGRRNDGDDGDGRGGSRDGRDHSLLDDRVGSRRDRSGSRERRGSSARRNSVGL